MAIRSKTHRNKSSSLETKQQGRKRNIDFGDTIPALSVYDKRSFNEKVESQPLPWQNFKEPPKVLYLWERKIMAKDMLVRAKT